MYETLYPISILLVALITFGFTILYTRGKKYICAVLISFFITLILFLIELNNLENIPKISISEISIRSLMMILSFVVATIALLVTVKNNNKTSQNNLDVHHTNLLIKMIENNYKLIGDEELDKLVTDNILKPINELFTDDYIKLKCLVFMVGKAQPKIDEKIFGENLSKQNFPESTIESMKKLTNYNLNSIEKLTLAYLRKKDEQWFNKLKKLHDKSFKHEEYLFLVNTTSTKSFKKELDKYYNDLKRMNKSELLSLDIEWQKILEPIDKIYNHEYSNIGHFFRHSYRIIKLINKYYPENEEKRSEFLGILRAYYSEDILLALYYNCTYTIKGKGMGYQLLKSNFFGDKKDMDNHDLLHFRKEKLILADIDVNVIKILYTSNNSNHFPTLNREEIFENGIKEGFKNSIVNKENS